MTRYLSIEDVIAIHDDQIERYGGSPGLRDQGLLEAAVHRAQNGYYDDVIAEAAALWESLSQNHAFVDGNKRVAFGSTFTFLAANGLTIDADPLEAYSFLIGLYETGNLNMAALDAWLRAHTATA